MIESLIKSLVASGYHLLTTVPIIVLSIIFAEFLVKKGLLQKISFIGVPISRISHLGNESVSALLTAFLSPTASAAMLRDYYSKGLISRRELIIASLAKALPAIVTEARFMLPPLLTILGMVGLYYFLIQVSMSLMITSIACLLGFFLLPQRPLKSLKVGADPLPLKVAIKESLKDSGKIIKKILITLIPATVGASILAGMGIFSALGDRLREFSQYLPIPPKGLPIVAVYIVSPIASYPIASTLLAQGVTAKEVIISFLWGGVLAIPMHLKSHIPFYIGIYGPRTGLELFGYFYGLRSLIAIMLILAIYNWIEV